MTRRQLLVAFTVALVVGPTGRSHAGDTENRDGGRGRWGRLEVRERRALEFGYVASDIHFSGSVTIDADTGTRTIGGGLADFGGSYGRAEFLLRGRPGATVVVSFPSRVTATARRGSASMTVRDIKAHPGNPIVLDRRGEATVYLGGTLDIPAGQPGDRYAAPITLTADYQDGRDGRDGG